MSGSQRVYFGEMLRRARDERMFVLAAATARGSHRRSRALPPLQSAEAATLASIVCALDRLSRAPALYGRCELCGRAVPNAMLDQEPWIRRCAVHREGHLGLATTCDSTLPC